MKAHNRVPAWLAAILGAQLIFGIATAASQPNAAPQRTGLTVQGQSLLLDGKPFKIISGEMHYARIPREYWRARLKMARAMGLNTIATYVFWNVHEPKPGVYDFSGNNDLATYVRMAQEEGLYVILRSGPYACAEWDLGGLPAWLLATPESAKALRTRDPLFMDPVKRWVHRLAAEVAPLQYGNGGPIILTQIENEYGNYGSDKDYMNDLHQLYLQEGFTKSLLMTADNWHNIAKGDSPGVFAGTNFGVGNHQGGMDALERERPGQPLFVSEYWPGWFDQWGHPHETRPVKPQIEDLEYILKRGAGVNIYMFHGGTNFGYFAGSSGGKNFLPDATTYDYDAPLDEAGHPTEKYFAFRKVLAQFNEAQIPEVPETPPVLALPAMALTERASLWTNLPKPMASEEPLPMEHFGEGYGYILYRKTLHSSPAGELSINDVHDFALVYLDGALVATIDRRRPDHPALKLPAIREGERLDILVANDGHINHTHDMQTDNKGITHAVSFNGTVLKGWEVYLLPLGEAGTHLFPAKYNKVHTAGPAFYRATFKLSKAGDTFLDIRQLGKGALWINGHAIGRFWNVGPQDTLYVPGPWLKKGTNTIVVFDLLNTKDSNPIVEGLRSPILDGPIRERSNSATPKLQPEAQ
ncbi:MAG TPA: glycoside hydrolase family 35 protein [Terracidiphilus sp.]